MQAGGIDLREVSQNDAGLAEAVAMLDRLAAMPGGYREREGDGRPLSIGFGLYRSGLSAEADSAYRSGLRRILLPRLLLALEDEMLAAASDPIRLYEPLKAYLMLGSAGPMDTDAVQRVLRERIALSQFPAAEDRPARDVFMRHADLLLADENLAAVWPRRMASLDTALVADVRARLGTLSLSDRAYAIMREKAAGSGDSWQVAANLSRGDVRAFRNPEALLDISIPHFFTRKGFETVYTPGLVTVERDLKRDIWVMGDDAGTRSVQGELGDIRRGVAALYANAYIMAWEAVINAMQPARYFEDREAFGALTKSPSPMKTLLLELARETRFDGGAAGAARDVANRAFSGTMSRLELDSNAAVASGGGASGLSAATEIQNHFAELRAYVGDGETPGQLDELIAAIRRAGEAVDAARNISGGGASDSLQAAMAQATSSVNTAAATAPAILQPFAREAAAGGGEARISAVQGAVGAQYQAMVFPVCEEVAKEHYPFSDAPRRMRPLRTCSAYSGQMV